MVLVVDNDTIIYDVVVLPKYHGKGGGRQIVQSLLEKLPEGALYRMYVVQGKQKFYEKFGFGCLPLHGAFSRPR